MRYLSIMIVLVFFTTILSASHFRSIRVGSFITKADAQKSLVKLNKYINKQKNIVHFQKKMFFEAKVIKVGKYYMNVVEPFGDNKKELQEIVDTLRKRYPHAYIKKIKGKMPTHHTSQVKKQIEKKKIVKTEKKIEKKLEKKIEKKVVKKEITKTPPKIDKKVQEIKPLIIPVPVKKEIEIITEVVKPAIVIVEENISKEQNRSVLKVLKPQVIAMDNSTIEEIVITELADEKIIEEVKESEPEVAVVEVKEPEPEVAVVEVKESEPEVAVVEVKEPEPEVAVVEVKESEPEVAVVEVKESEPEVAVVEVKEPEQKESVSSKDILELYSFEIKIVGAILITIFLLLSALLIWFIRKVASLKKENLNRINNEQSEQSEELENLKRDMNRLKAIHEESLENLELKNKEKINKFKEIYNSRAKKVLLENEEKINEILLSHENEIQKMKDEFEEKMKESIQEREKEKTIQDEEIITISNSVPPVVEESSIEKENIVKEIVNIDEESEALTVSIGLGNCDGDADFYNTILKEFKQSYINSPDIFEELCGNNSFEDARYLAGEIKDFAVNIGAYSLCESVASMEYEFEKGSSVNWKKLVDNYKVNLDKLIIEIDDYTNKN